MIMIGIIFRSMRYRVYSTGLNSRRAPTSFHWTSVKDFDDAIQDGMSVLSELTWQGQAKRNVIVGRLGEVGDQHVELLEMVVPVWASSVQLDVQDCETGERFTETMRVIQ